jgi:hypothetical protein
VSFLKLVAQPLGFRFPKGAVFPCVGHDLQVTIPLQPHLPQTLALVLARAASGVLLKEKLPELGVEIEPESL